MDSVFLVTSIACIVTSIACIVAAIAGVVDVLLQPAELWKAVVDRSKVVWVLVILLLPLVCGIGVFVAWSIYARGDRRLVKEQRAIEANRWVPPPPTRATEQDGPSPVTYSPGLLEPFRCSRCGVAVVGGPATDRCWGCDVRLDWEHSPDALARWRQLQEDTGSG